MQAGSRSATTSRSRSDAASRKCRSVAALWMPWTSRGSCAAARGARQEAVDDTHAVTPAQARERDPAADEPGAPEQRHASRHGVRARLAQRAEVLAIRFLRFLVCGAMSDVEPVLVHQVLAD